MAVMLVSIKLVTSLPYFLLWKDSAVDHVRNKLTSCAGNEFNGKYPFRNTSKLLGLLGLICLYYSLSSSQSLEHKHNFKITMISYGNCSDWLRNIWPFFTHLTATGMPDISISCDESDISLKCHGLWDSCHAI